MFKIGDKVRVLDDERKHRYKQIMNKIGEIARISTYIDPYNHVENTLYYVEIPEFINEYQGNGWWVFKNANSLRLISDEVTWDDSMDAYEYGISTRTDWADILLERNLINEKGDKNNMEELTQIYMDRKLKKINDKFENLIEDKKLNDERYKTFKKCIDTLDKLYKEDNVNPLGHYKDINLSEQTLKDIELLEKIRCAEEERVAIKIYEVRAQLSLCETYDQKQEILRRYNIINKNGKVNG